jgi:hypothetical protein
MKRQDAREAADMLRRLVRVVERGEVTASKMNVYMIEGAAIGLDEMAQPTGRARPTRGTSTEGTPSP